MFLFHPLEQFLSSPTWLGPELVFLVEVTAFSSLLFSAVASDWVLTGPALFTLFVIQTFVRRMSEGHMSVRSYAELTYCIFIYVISYNLAGALPFVPTVTAHIVFTFLLGGSVFWASFILTLGVHGVRAASTTVPSGVPPLLMPFLAVIELISFFARGISISVRLFANMLSGHILVKIVLAFAMGSIAAVQLAAPVGLPALLGSALVLFATAAIVALETIIALLQGYVFTVMTATYLNDGVWSH